MAKPIPLYDSNGRIMRDDDGNPVYPDPTAKQASDDAEAAQLRAKSEEASRAAQAELDLAVERETARRAHLDAFHLQLADLGLSPDEVNRVVAAASRVFA